MREFTLKKLMNVSMIRTPVTGPAPANTLAYISGKFWGEQLAGTRGEWDRVALTVNSDFRIDGYTQANHEWHEANAIVSATAMPRWLETSVDMHFGLSIDNLSYVWNRDGTLSFVVEMGIFGDPDTWFTAESAAIGGSISAWILLYEPQTEMPPTGWQRPQMLRASINEALVPHLARPSSKSQMKQSLGSDPCGPSHDD
jgi:hypothetical protein